MLFSDFCIDMMIFSITLFVFINLHRLLKRYHNYEYHKLKRSMIAYFIILMLLMSVKASYFLDIAYCKENLLDTDNDPNTVPAVCKLYIDHIVYRVVI